jgi:hypothetical protein
LKVAFDPLYNSHNERKEVDMNEVQESDYRGQYDPRMDPISPFFDIRTWFPEEPGDEGDRHYFEDCE